MRQNALWAIGLCLASITRADDSGIERAGDVLQLLVPAAALVHSLRQHDPKGSNQLLCAGLATMSAVMALKVSINRTRPNGGRWSFPSGHTASAFLGAGFMHKRYGLKAALPSYALASFVGFSRVHAKKYHLSDVLAGAALALSLGFYFTDERRSMNLEAHNSTLSLSLAYRF